MSFTLAGKTASDLGVRLKSGYQEPVSPNIRKRELTIPGKAGKINCGDEYDVRTFELPLVTVNTTTKAGVQDVIRQLIDELTNNPGEPREVSLSFDKEPNLHYGVKLNQSSPVDRHPAHFAEFALNLVATQPFACGNKETITANITHSPQGVEIQNNGSVETSMVITITNNGDNTINGFELSKE